MSPIASWAVEAPHDPVRVFYPAGECTTGVLELELWNRVVEEWRPHPAHARIMGDTCQVEDAGELLNEIRVRCIDPANPARASQWRTGVQVYEPSDAPGCVAPDFGVRPRRNPRVALTRPSADAPFAAPERTAPVAGRVQLSHDLVVLVDASFDRDARAEVVDALADRLLRDEALLGPMRLAWLAFDADPAASVAAPVSSPALSDEAGRLRAQLDALRVPGRGPGVHGFGAALDAALAPLADPADRGDRRTIVALVNARSGHPFGDAAGRDPAHRRDVLAAVDRVVRAGVALEVFAVGRPERDLAELAGQVRERVVSGGAGGGLDAVEKPRALAEALPRIAVVTMRAVRVENLTSGAVAEPLTWDRAGGFEGRVPMESGRNLLRVRARLSSGEEIVADFERRFDPTALRERLRAAERTRIERARDAERNGTVTIDVEER